ncbi:putative 5-3 exonuclease [Jimgerdemannia flammicorona]|uniref:Putative 5-3 exonuclease n=1 Tax=Jimgerdemannia flammicorona TaxID=994334 RepID=A0A433PCG9_9FUNG|nr:putative 5-3 exonuclease [Jimgerdemannia flammicorona]
MGVPALFRWLTNKYPKLTTVVVEDQPTEVNGVEIPVDTSKPNPNGEEFDNLYLDMNGIIHPCCHPENKPAPASEEEMMIEIFEYMDRIVAMVRPRKILYMAIGKPKNVYENFPSLFILTIGLPPFSISPTHADGVAPRAKMNQQRSRRFRSSQLSRIEAEEKEKVLRELEAAGQLVERPEKKAAFDSNCITPGTPFMGHLAECLRYHIAHKLNTDPGWKNVSA